MIEQLAGNGRVLLTVNENGEWNELFYPHPGLFQHLREMRLGVYDVRERKFAWLRRGNGYSMATAPDGAGNLPGSRWTGAGVTLHVQDLVHPNHDLVMRVIRVRADPPRPLRIFSYHSFHIAESMYQDTAYVDPSARSLVHYKRGFYFGFFSDPTFTRAACGEHTLKGLQGTYVDAEDGVLDGRTIAHGAADSALQFDIDPVADRDTTVHLFLAIGRSPSAIAATREYVRAGGPERFEEEARAFWQAWVGRRQPKAPAGLSERIAQLYASSMLVMRHATGTNGAIIASPDTASLVIGGDTYNYCWWRDGGYVSKAMDEAGLYEYSRRFLDFAMSCQSPDGSFLHRHFPDGAIGSTWHPPPFLQVDQTATVIAATWHHFKHGRDPDVLLDLWPLVKGAANFLTEFRDPATRLPASSFDLWEERQGIHAYSTAAVVHALERAARIAQELGKDPARWRAASQEIHTAAVEKFWDPGTSRFVRSLSPRSDALDASLLLSLKLGFLPWDDPRARQMVDQIEARLWKPGTGGLARYEGDQYYGTENPWIVCTLWLAEARLRLGNRDRCRELLEWVAEHETATRLLPEQIDSATGAPKSATPLTWSHSTFVDVVHKYTQPAPDSDPGDS
ncbi:MAG: glycoside hydrolase family 15 protein [Thermoplasmata archaeon]|nr:glycoside hydrolase family 15 protein [Thermoplasmata archaeon]